MLYKTSFDRQSKIHSRFSIFFCFQDPAECEAYLQNGYIKLSEFKLIEQTAFVDRFTNEKCVKAFDHIGIIREVALYAVDLPSSERKDPLRHASLLHNFKKR